MKPAPPAAAQQSIPAAQPVQSGMGGDMRQMQAMDSMAQSVKAMADMCREMMQHEMAMMPAKMVAGLVFASLLGLALILLIVLQIQWIVHWKRVLGTQRPG